MHYISTRDSGNRVHRYSFLDAVLEGLAPDGGLLVPEVVPQISAAEWAEWSMPENRSDYQKICFFVLRKYIAESDMSDVELKGVIDAAYGASFSDKRIAPVVVLPKINSHSKKVSVMELFHGPTFAFKDVALQLLGHLFDFALKKRNRRMTILGATSGDTGSAAIAGVKGRANVDCVILFPLGKTSKIQELQMTSNLDKNIHCIGVRDSCFDDCQSMVKHCFNDLELREKLQLGAVNSINWARISAQIVYYIYAVLNEQGSHVTFSVPTGNFGNILAGYYAKQMGTPGMGRLIVASNSNDILPKFFESGKYIVPPAVLATLSPSMDIAVSSNFERFLFDLWHRDGAVVADKFAQLSKNKEFSISSEERKSAQSVFASYRVNEEETMDTIANCFAEHGGYLLCPHSAVGFAAALKYASENDSSGETIISLATAHVGKFSEQLLVSLKNSRHSGNTALIEAVANSVPGELRKLTSAPTKLIQLNNSVAEVKEFLNITFLA